MSEKIFVSIDDERFEATGELLEEINKRAAEYEAFKTKQIALQEQKASAKSALLNRLGITEEEAQLLLA